MKLVVVESPNKIKTISKILGSEYTVLATAGHIRLIKPEFAYRTGIDVNHDFKMSFEFDPSRKDLINKIKETAKNAEEIFVCSDGDREGESIADEIRCLLKDQKKKLRRAIFNEITPKAVKHAIENPVPFDENMILAAETRQTLDRLIGYRVSPVVKQIGCESAGRVQSALLQLICKKEYEIQKFIPTKYFDISLFFTKNKKEYSAKLNAIDGKKVDKIENEETAKKNIEDCKTGKYTISNIASKEKELQPKLPMTSAALQQLASNVLGFSPSKTMTCAQHLFESAFITYHRTDSVRFSDDFIKAAKEKITADFGKAEYRGLVIPKAVNEDAQNGHESIRPTDLKNSPESVASQVEQAEGKLYKLIYNHTLACFFVPAIIETTTVEIINGKYKFNLSGKKIKKESFLSFYNTDVDEVILPDFKIGEELKKTRLELAEKETQPPSRYSEAGLVKLMKDTGIGRPSTYAGAIETLKKREYISVEKRSVHATEKGIQLDKAISKYFLSVINTEYTSKMEEDLDKIAVGSEDKLEKLNEFWENFEPVVVSAYTEIKKDKPAPEILEGKVCPKCGKPLFIRKSKFGRFAACSGYPKCKYTASLDEDNNIIEKEKKAETSTGIICPKCKKGMLVERTSKKTGETFYGCNKFPKCKFTMKKEEFDKEYKKK